MLGDSQLADEPVFHALPRPRRFPQEREAGFHRGIELKTADGNAPSHLAPAMPLHELVENRLQRDAVQRIARMRCGFRHDRQKRRPEKFFGNVKVRARPQDFPARPEVARIFPVC